MFGTHRNDSSTHGEKLDYVRTPGVAAFFDANAHNTFRFKAGGLGLHALHRELTRVIERLGEVGHLSVASDGLDPLAEALVCHVIDAVAHDQPNRTVASLDERPEILSREIACKRLAPGGAMISAVASRNGRANGHELGEV